MDKEMFNELLTSVEQMEEIVHGKAKPSRQFDFPELQVRETGEES